MGKIIAKIFLFFLLVVGVALVLLNQVKKPNKQENLQQPRPSMTVTQEKKIDFNASFAIFTNGTFRIFTDPRYHNLSPEVFLQAENPNVVHVKKMGITWGDFFKTLPMQLTQDCLTTGTGQKFCTQDSTTLKFYLNGVKMDNLLQVEIREDDRALISYGSEGEAVIKEQMEILNKMDEK